MRGLEDFAAAEPTVVQQAHGPYGVITFTVGPRGLTGVAWGPAAHAASTKLGNAAPPPPRTASPVEMELSDRALHLLTEYLHGEPVDLTGLEIDDTGLTPFARRVTRACRGLRWGETSTYAGLAARVGSPRGARAVGGVMARNRWPIVVPCHRVLGSCGALTGFSAPGGIASKRSLLAMEKALDSPPLPLE